MLVTTSTDKNRGVPLFIYLLKLLDLRQETSFYLQHGGHVSAAFLTSPCNCSTDCGRSTFCRPTPETRDSQRTGVLSTLGGHPVVSNLPGPSAFSHRLAA